MTKLKHTGLLKLAAIIFAVLMAHSGAFSGSSSSYAVSPAMPVVPSISMPLDSVLYSQGTLSIRCPEDISVFSDLDKCSAHIVEGLDIEVNEGSIASLAWKMEGATDAASPLSGINQITDFVFNVGVTFVHYTAIDITGVQSVCSFSVVVTDKQAPEISVPENITIGCNERVPSPYTTLQALLNAGGNASDNCYLNPATFKLVSEEKSNANCPYTIIRTYQIADRQGNVGQAQQLILVEKRPDVVLQEEEGALTLKSGMAVITSTAIGGNWNTGTSWVGGAVPLPGDDIIIVSGATISLTGNQICNDITINGTLNCGIHTLQANGSWTNNGTFNAGTGTVEFAGASNAAISGSSATVFRNFRIAKGAVANVLQINKDITLGGTITFTSGLVQVNSGATVNCSFNTGFTIANIAGIFINGGIFTGGAFQITNNGLFRIDSGTASLGSNSGNSIVVGNSGTIDINGGTVNIAGRLEVSGGTADISGGTINLNTVGHNSSAKGSLDLSLASKFSMSAGTINFLNPNGTGNFDVIMLNGTGGVKNFTGGVFNFGDGTTDTYKISSAVPFPSITAAANTSLQFRRLVTSTGTFSFPLVNNLGNSIPATVQLAAGTIAAGAFIDVNTTGSKFIENKTTGNFLNRYWNVATNGITNPSFNVTATYANADIAGDEAKIAMGAWTGSRPWVRHSAANTATNTITTSSATTGTNLVFAGIANDPPTVSIVNGASTTICNGNSIALTTSASGDPVITYSWSPATGLSATNIPNPVASPTATTTYTVTVTDGNGFTATDNIVVNVNLIPAVNLPVNQTVCSGASTSAVNFTGTGTSHNWTNSNTAIGLGASGSGNIPVFSATNSTSGTISGTITVTPVYSNGGVDCTGPAKSFTITVNPIPTVNSPASQIVCNGASTNAVNFTGTGTSYSWTNSNTAIGLGANGTGSIPAFTATNSTTNVINSTITVTPIYSNGGVDCTGPAQSFTISVIPTPTVNSVGNQTVCNGTSTTLVNFNGTASTFTWTNSNAAIGLATNGSGNIPGFTATNNTTNPITGTITVTPVFSNGGVDCSGPTQSFTITVTPSISASANVTDVIKCFGGTANVLISASGGTPPYTFNFPGKPSNQTGVFSGVIGSVAGTNYNWSVTDALNCAAASGSINVTQPEELTANATASSITCNGLTSTVTITASGGTPPLSYTFNGVTKNNGTFTGITAGTYTWSVKDANNCTPVTGTLPITQPAPITITSANVTAPVTCNGGTGTVTIVATGGTGALSYTFNGQTNATGVFSGVYAGNNLSYSVKDANNCGPAFGSITVNEPTAITATAAVSTAITCNGGTATVTITAAGGSGALSYTFNGVTQASNIFTGVTPGNNIPWSVTDANNCGPVSGTLNIAQPAALTASVSETTSIGCFGGTANIQITAAGGTGTKTYSFQGQPNNQTGIFNAIPGAVAPGTPYSWSVTDANGCSTSGTHNVVQPAQIVIGSIGSNSPICQGETLNLTSAATGGTGTLRYSWTGPNGYTANNAQNPSIVNATPSAGGTYTLTVTDANNCTATSTVNATVNATPTLAKPADQTVCHNASTTAVNFPGPNTYTWTNSDPTIGLGASGTGSIAPFFANNTGTTPVTATITVTPSGNGCTGTVQTFTITVNPVPEVTATNNTPILCDDGVTNIVLSSNVSGTTFSWIASRTSGSTSGFSSGSGTSITHTLSNAGTVDYIITPTANGCVGATATVSIEVISSDYDLNVNVTGSHPATVCSGYAFNLGFTGNSGSGNSGGWYQTQWEWVTRFTWTNNNISIGLGASGGPVTDPGSISFTTQNTTEVDQTATITITPWSFYRSRSRWFWESWPAWPAWQQLCSGNAYSTTITVNPFAITCPADIAANTDANECFATITQPAPALSCGSGANISWTATGATPASGNDGLSGVRFPKGTTTVNYTATRGGITRNCSFKVTVTDSQAPVISNCPPATTTLAMQSGSCGAPFSFNPTATDNCSPFTFVRTDGTGLNSGDIFPAGTTRISYLATDEAGNTATCSFDVVVSPDNQPPAITCAGNQTGICAPAGSGYTMLGTAWDATVVENCPGAVTKTYVLSGATTGTGTSLNNVQFNVGTTRVTWTAKDILNNTSTCFFDVEVTQSPEVTSSPASQTVCLDGSLTFTATATGAPVPTFQWRKNGTPIPGATSASLTLNTIVAGDAGTYDVEVTNSCGSAISAPAVLTVSTLPMITQQPASQSDCRGETVIFRTTVVGGSGNYSYYWESKRPADANFRDATRNNNWVTFPADGEMLVPNLGNARSPDQTQYRVTVTDDCGKSVTSDAATLSVNQITNIDLVLSTICQGFGTSFTVTTSGSTPIVYQWRRRNALGNWVNVNDGGAYSGATTATLTINNATTAESGDYSARAQFNITVPNNNNATTCWENDYTLVGTLTVDEGPAIVATPANQTICSGKAITEIVLTDTNGIPGTTFSWTRDNSTILTGMPVSGNGATINGTLTSLDPTNLQTTVFTITATTANGCVSTGQVSVSVGDVQDPTVATCPTNISVDATAGICGAVVNYTAPTFADNCDGTGLSGTLVAGLASGAEFPVGTTTVTYEFTDAAGNGPVSCSFDVTVTDKLPPVVICQPVIVELDATGNVAITAADIDNGTTDNCGVPTLSIDITSFDCTDLGPNTVTLTATDGTNTATCTATVTVEDNILPTAVCKNATIQLDATGNAAITATDIDNGSTDNCGIASMTVSPNTFDCSNIGTNTVELTVTDLDGNIAKCTATVTVEDKIAPSAVCKNITVQLDATGNATITANDIDNGSTDNCGIASMSVSQSTFNCTTAGANTVTLTVTDVNGNSSTCNATVTIEDNVDPVALCKDITIQLDAAGNASITPANIDNGSTDNCGIPVLTIDINTFDCTKLGDNTVTLTATDGVGNTHSCAAIVTVADDNFPVAITANVSQTTIDCFGETATVTITKTSGGVGTLTYTFNGVSNATGIFNNIPAGNAYAWSVTNPLGCGNISGTFNVIQPQKLSANVTITDVTCSNNDATITISNPQGGSGNYEFTNNGGTTWQTALVFSGLVPGTYNVQMRDANVPSCKVVLNSNVTVHKLSADHASTNVTCFGSNDGTITISDPHGGSNSYQYTVNGGTTWVNTANFTGLAPGTYDVRIRDANEHACELTLDAALQITQPDVLGANIASTSMTCNGDNNGTITVSLPTGGYGTYQVSINGTNWFNVTTAAPHVFTNLAAGSYTAQIRDAAQTGCTINLNPVTITEPAVLAATVNSTNVTCFGSADGTISITSPTGGFGTYEYSINGGGSWQSSGSFSSLSPGAYDIRIRDAAHNACQITLNGNLIITEPLVPNVIVPSDQPVCNGASTTAVSFTGDVPGTVFKWTNNTPSIGLAVSGTGDIASFTAVNTGNTVVTATITVTPEFVNGGVTCTGTPQTFTYVVYPTADAVATPSAQTLCTGGTTAIALSSGVSGATFDWTVVQTDVTGASDGSGNTIAQTLTATGTSAGTATYTIIPTANGCPGTPTIVVVTVNPEPQVNQPLDQEICNGTSTGMITFSTSNTAGTTTYTWINSEPLIGLAAAGSGSIIAPFTGTNAGTQPLVGTITVTPHLSNGGITCDGPSKTFTITVNPQPRATAPIGLTYCNGILSDPYPLAGTPSGVLFDISGGASIGLADVAGVSEIPAFTPTAAGTASLTIVPKYNGCTGLPVSFNVTVRPTPIATMAGGATVCQNAAPPSITITNPMNLAVLVTYTINGTITNTVNIPSKSNVSIAVPTNAAGTFTYDLVSVQYLDSNPPVCPNNSITGTATVEVTALPVPVITGPTDICAETTSHVYSTEAGMSNYTWVVSSAGTITAGGSPTDNTVTVTWNTGGSHNISVRYNNANGCGAPVPTIFPVNVFTRPIPTITGSTSACLNTSKVYSTQPGMTNYLWNVSAGATITAGGGVADNSVTVTWSGVGAQTVSVNYTTLDGCDAPAQTVKNITVNPLPNPTITGPARACAGTNGNVYTTEPGMSTYVWVVSVGGTVTSGGSSNSNTATIRWNTDGPQTVSISYLNPATGCTPASATVYNVSVDPMPVPTIVGLASVCVGATGITYTSEPGMSNYVWTVSAGGTRTAGGGAADNFVTVSWNTAGANSVRVNYQNANGCSATTATIRNVTVNPLPNPVIAGTVQACVGSTITYSTLAGMSNYQWTIPAGATVVSGGSATDNQVKLTWTATGNHTISLNYTNANGCSALAPTNYAVTVNALPTPTITGPADACKGGAVTVYTTQPGMVGYIWTISGGTITAGGSANDNTATVVWNTVGTQTIGVNYYNANNCAAAAPFVYPVNVLAPAPPTCPINRVVCSSDVPFNLTGGLPVGGAYAGPGVTLAGGNYVFSPATAGPGVHTITYTMPNICADQCSFTITVNETPIGSATPITICSGYPTDLVLNSTVPGTTFTWTASVTSGSVTGFTNCSGGSCGNMIKDTLTNNLIVNPGQNGANAVVRYVVTATKDGCSSTFNVNVTVRPQVKTYNLTWNSNFVEDFIEVCAGAEALSDNDIEVLDPSNGNLVGSAQIPATWNPTFLYGPSPAGPWTSAPGSWKGGSYYEWLVDFSINNRLGYHYFILQITDPVTGCIKYSNPAILNVVSALVVEAGDPEFICGGSSVPLTGSYVGGLSSSTIQGRWTVTNMSPAHGNNGTLSNTNFTTNPAGVSYTPPNGYIGTVTLTLTTNDPSGVCAAVTDTRTVTVAPPTSFLGCRELAGWPLTGTNSNGSRDDSEEPCLVTLVGSDNLSGSAGNTNITHCTGVGNISFNWTFLAPPNKIVWHQEDQTSGSNSSTTNLRVARPTNVVAGDLIIITVHINDNNLNFTPGNGFTQIINTTHNSRTATVASFYKIATGSEPANYNIAVGGGNVGSNDRIYASRVTGHNVTTPIGGSNGTTLTFPYTNGENGYRNISIAGFPTGANTMLVAALAVDINNDNVLEFSNAPIGMTTVYYDDNETSTRVATAIVSGNTGTRRFQWPSYNSRNRETMYAAAQMFTINPATNERDEAFFTVNGNATLLGNTNGASGSRTVSVASGDVFGFRVGTLTNTGGPGRLVIYNLTMPNDTPVLTGKDSVFVDDCQNDAFLPTFEDPTVTDDCGIPVVKTGYPVTDVVVSNGCARSQKRTWVYVDDCGQESLPFTQTAVWSVLAPITLSCPVDPMLEPCTDPAVITARYNDWVAGFVATGGCSMTTNSYAVPPLILANIACGDTLYFKFIATDACGQKDSCTSTFTVKPITTLNVVCPADVVLPSCTDTASIRAAYNTWKAGFSYDGGCAAVTDNMIDFPPLTDLTCGAKLEFIYSVFNSCGQNASCVSTFTVEPPQPLSVVVPAGVSLPLCSKTTDIETAYNDWKAGFSYSGGCNVITNIDELPALGDITCGGVITFTYTARNKNSACEDLQEATSTFTVAEAPDLIVSCPVDPNIEGCLGIQAITDAYDTWVDGFRASGGCNITTNIASIPPLGDLVCNGQLTFTFIVGNDSELCSDHVECTSTFTIGAAPQLQVIVPADTVMRGCNTSQEAMDAFNAWKTQFSHTGGCNVSASDLSIYGLPSSCGGTVTVKYTVWDNCSQMVTDSAKFTLNPDYISVNAPIDEIQPACQTQAEIDEAFDIWKAKFRFSGGCGTVGTDLSVIDAPDACGGTIVVNYSAQDVCGQVVNTSAIFTIDAPSDVLQEPSFTVPPAVTIYRDNACAYDARPGITGFPSDLADNCTAAGNLNMTHSDSTAFGSCSSELIIFRTWIVSDNCLNQTSKMQIITVTDSIPPVVLCAADVNGVADNGECDATNVALGNTTATDNCALASFEGVRSDGLSITDPFPVGVTTITWTAIDACGNTSTCIQTVTLVDGITQPPVITCPADVEQNAGPNNCYLENVSIPNPSATDNCEVATISWVMTGATTGSSVLTGFNYVGGETFNVGVTTVTYTATDSAGNYATCAFKVTIKDVTPPVIAIGSCVDISENAAPNNCSKVPATLIDPDYSDTCWPKDSLRLSWVLTGATTGSGQGTLTNQSFNVGLTTVVVTVTDPDGNTDDCSFTVTILDVTDPVIDISSCANVSEVADADNCSKTPLENMDPTYSDNCWPVDSLDLTYVITGATTGSGSGSVTGLTFNVGVSTVEYTVTDPDGNSASCSFTVTIIDVTPPVINLTLCADVTDVAAPNNCSKVPGDLKDPDYSDTCWPKDSLTISWTMTGATTGSGFGTVTDSAFHVGVTTVTYTVTDPDNNSASCSFTVTIKDVTPPNIDIAGCENVTDVTDDGNCAVVPGNIDDPVYSDACWDVADLTITWQMTGATTGSGTGSVVGQSFNAGVTTVKYVVSDPDGNKDSCSFTVTIIPYNPPAFRAGCPPDIISAPNDPGICEADLTIPDPTVDDPCNVGYTITNNRTGTNNASGVYPVGTTEVIWTITPNVGNPTTCTQTITVIDTELPVIVDCPQTRNFTDCSVAAITGPAFSATTASSTYAEFADATNLGNATDNCGIVSVTYIDVQAGSCPITITRTWTVFDAAGNSASCDQTITIDDTEAPVVDCPTAGFETPSDFDLPYATYSIPAFDYSDNCTAQIDILISWTLSGATTGSGTGLIPTPYQFNSGLTTVSYVFTDLCGNPTPCEFTIFALFPPEITCLPPVTLNTDLGVCHNHIEPGDTDNPGVPTNGTGEVLDWTWTVYAPDGTTVLGTGTSTGVSPTPVGPVDFPIGTSTIHWYAKNASGHDECDQLVTVFDNGSPTFDADPFEDCVESLSSAVYTGNADDIQYNPDYPDGDYKIMNPGDPYLDIDLGTYVDNCCVLADGYSLFWTIEFDGNDPNEPDITGTGQPSTYKDPISGAPMEILLWGDGVNFQPRVHTITYTITDCNGNTSDPVVETITINPRPQLIKVTN